MSRSKRMQDIYQLVNEPYSLAPTPSRGSISSQPMLKGLLSTVAPENKEIPMEAYLFPNLKKFVDDLQSQLISDETKSILWLGTEQFMFLKNLVVQIEQKINNRKIPKTTSYGVSIDVLLLLIGKLQQLGGRFQQTKLKQIMTVMDKFILIEKCLIGKIEDKVELRAQLVYDLDILFESFLIEILSATDPEEWTPSNINRKLKRRLTAVSQQDLHPMIDECTTETETTMVDTRTTDSLYVKVRNQLLLLCNEFGIELPTPLTITMEYIRNSGKLLCENLTSIENIIAVFVMMGHSKKQALLISGLIKFYCDMLQKDAKMSSVTRFLLVLAQVKKAQDREEKKKADKLMPETLEFANKATKTVNKKETNTVNQLNDMYSALGLPLINEEQYTAISSQEAMPIQGTKERRPSKSKSKKESVEETESTEQKEPKLESKIPVPKGPRGNEYALFGRYTNPLSRTSNVVEKNLIQNLQDKITEFDLDPTTAGMLLTGLFALRRSFQIEGWHTLVRSFNYHIRKKLGEKLRGREPATPTELISRGRTDLSKEKEIYIAFNRSTALSNIMLMGASVYSFVTYKIMNALSGTSEDLMEEEISQEENESAESVYD